MPPTSSYWIASTPETAYPALDADLEVDVVVIGAGIVGTTAAYLLAREGRSVAVLEMGRIGRGATGYTTAKVTSGHSLIYGEIEKKHGLDKARAYASANQDGLDLIRDLIAREEIECDLEAKSNYVYVEDASEAGSIESEVEAETRAGLPARVVTETSLPYRTAAAIELPDQAQFHPRKYVLALADRTAAAGGRIFEETRATGLGEGEICTVETERGTVSAPHVVVASHYPFVDRAFLFPRVHPKRSYAIAGEVPAETIPDGMFISSDEPTRSVRTIPDGDRTLVMVGGEGHSVGQNYDTDACYSELERWARERFGMERPEYRWSTQDGMSVDKIPFIGRYRGSANVYVATAFGKWGFTNGSVGARLIVNQIGGREDRYASLYDPSRFEPAASAQKLILENSKVAKHFVRDRVAHPQRSALDDLAPGEAGVDDLALRPVAGYRDDSGRLHKLSAVCTHLGCIVTWNGAERSWDCPCHGSRFDHEGRVIQGPAVDDLDRLD